MARSQKQLDNLKPFRKGEYSEEELKKRQRNGGKKSAEVRRAKRDARQAAKYILNLKAKGTQLENAKAIGAVEEDGITNMEVLQARLYVMALGGNIEAYRELMKIAGYEPEENRKERESVASDYRRDVELKAKLETLGQNSDNVNVAVNMSNEDGNNDVVFYIPQMKREEDCLVEETEEETGETSDKE